VILAKTIKGYGLGEAGEGRNVTHQQKKLNEEELRYFRSRFGIPIPDAIRSKRRPFTARPRIARRCSICMSAAGLGGFARAQLVGAGVPAAGQGCMPSCMKGSATRGGHHHGDGPPAEQTAQGQENRALHRSDRAR
jgi:hypothetical protein